MKTKRKTRCSEQRAFQNRQNSRTRFKDNATKPTENQLVPVPGTALTAFLKRYREELLLCELSRELSLTLDCVDSLLMVVERGCHE